MSLYPPVSSNMNQALSWVRDHVSPLGRSRSDVHSCSSSPAPGHPHLDSPSQTEQALSLEQWWIDIILVIPHPSPIPCHGGWFRLLAVLTTVGPSGIPTILALGEGLGQGQRRDSGTVLPPFACSLWDIPFSVCSADVWAYV